MKRISKRKLMKILQDGEFDATHLAVQGEKGKVTYDHLGYILHLAGLHDSRMLGMTIMIWESRARAVHPSAVLGWLGIKHRGEELYNSINQASTGKPGRKGNLEVSAIIFAALPEDWKLKAAPERFREAVI